MLDDTGTTLQKLASHHRQPEQGAWIDRHVLVDRPAGAGWAGAVLSSDEPLVLDLDRVAWLPSLGEEPPPSPVPLRTVLLAPMDVGGRPIGVLALVRDVTPERFDADDVDWVCAMADLITGSMYA